MTGFVKNSASVSTLSVAPVASSDKIPFIFEKTEQEDSVKYNYVPFFNIPVFKHLMVFIYALAFLFVWSFFDKKNKVFVCDGLNVTLNMAAVIVSKIRRVRNVCVLTDMPGLMVGTGVRVSFVGKFITAINKGYLGSFSHYVFLTEAMNDVVNKQHRPYIVMEGLVNPESVNVPNELENKRDEKVVLYAGGLFERYGLDTLVKAFMKLPMNDARLVVYGNGPYVEKLKELAKVDSRIEYKGIRPNEEVVADEIMATLLVNPRPTTEEFTKYSFPSKNMEYMASGTPLLTTKLPGMPKEYYPYVYLFEEESVDGFKSTLENVLSKSRESLHQKGIEAKQFIVNNKNDVIQCSRIMKLIKIDL